MIEEKIESYAFTMMLIQLSFVLLGLAGIFPYSLEIAGMNVYDDIQDTSNSIQTMYSNVAEGGALTSVAITAMMLIMGVKIVLEFVILTLTGAYPLMLALGLPSAFALPISLLLGAATIYGLAIKFLGR